MQTAPSPQCRDPARALQSRWPLTSAHRLNYRELVAHHVQKAAGTRRGAAFGGDSAGAAPMRIKQSFAHPPSARSLSLPADRIPDTAFWLRPGSRQPRWPLSHRVGSQREGATNLGALGQKGNRTISEFTGP